MQRNEIEAILGNEISSVRLTSGIRQDFQNDLNFSKVRIENRFDMEVFSAIGPALANQLAGPAQL